MYDNPATLCGFGASCKTYKQAVDLNVSLLFDPSNDDIVEMGNLTFQVADQLPNSEVLIGWQTLKIIASYVGAPIASHPRLSLLLKMCYHIHNLNLPDLMFTRKINRKQRQ